MMKMADVAVVADANQVCSALIKGLKNEFRLNPTIRINWKGALWKKIEREGGSVTDVEKIYAVLTGDLVKSSR